MSEAQITADARRALTTPAGELAQALFDVENAIDDAVAKTAGFLALLPEMRATAGVSAVVGQPVFMAAVRASANLVEARGALVEGHNKLEALRRVMMVDLPPETTPVPKPGVFGSGIHLVEAA